MLCSISEKVFIQSSSIGLDDDFNNELWLQRWLNLIPKFIDWEINRQSSHIPYGHEVSKQLDINETLQVHGRLDRIDKSENGYAIIDYKTGEVPRKKHISAGEHVQLPMYALLNESHTENTSTQVEFVRIGDKNTVRSESIIKDDDLNNLKIEHFHRLQSFFESLNQGVEFTALANDETCERCDAVGVCRKSFWTA